ncbi:MAG: beta-ketoacyl synthase chain length factor [Crocinitomicaceae bacterium]|nr:beta-ketoacyl synthase chain length factor [Crocinitomicaceae bacterium]
MEKKMYIKAISAISPQLTYGDEYVQGDFQIHTKGIINAIEPNYLAIIPASLLRRMGKAVRMGIGAGLPLIKNYPAIDGVIIGTANGGLEDCIRFLNQIVDYEEGVLTPTNFVNSTPNAVAGQLALMGEKMGYNSTHTNGSLAFDNALLDAKLVLESSDKPMELLVGAVEEISDYNYNIDTLNKHYKTESISNEDLISSTTDGSLCGEGATMFVVSNEKEGAIAEVVDQFQICFPENDEIAPLIVDFLSKNKLTPQAIDLLLFGNAGDGRTDFWYNNLQKEVFPNLAIHTFKQFCGDYRTASAFACYQAIQLMQKHSIHGFEGQQPTTILVYNQFSGERHGFILLRKLPLAMKMEH